MILHTLAPLPATLALTAFLLTPGFAAESAPTAAPVPPAPASTEKNPGETAPEAPAAGEGKTRLADAVVTAKKAPEPAPYAPSLSAFNRPAKFLDTPQTVTVVSKQVLNDRVITNLRDAIRNSPGITQNAGEGGGSTPNGGDSFTIRGFAAVTDIFVDNIRDTAVYSRDMFATEQVEIAKGSSAVYQGRGTAGGSVNLVTKTPKAGNSVELATLASTANSVRGEIDANLDVSKETESVKDAGVAARIVVMGQTGGSPRSKDLQDDRRGVLGSVVVGQGKDTSLTLSHAHYEQDSDGDYGIPYGAAFGSVTNPGVAPVDYSNWYGVKGSGFDNAVADMTTFTALTKLDDRNTLRNTTRYNRNERDIGIYRPRGSVAGVNLVAGTVNLDPTQRLQTLTTLSNQTDLVSKFTTGPVAHTLNVGAELQQEKSEARLRAATGPQPVVNLYRPNPNTPATQTFAYTGAANVVNADTYAVYVNETLHATEQVDLIGGLRYDRFEASLSQFAAAPATTVTTRNREDDLLSWRTGVVLKPVKTVSVYGTVANTFNPAVNNLAMSATPPNLNEVKPEKTLLYEVGVKWDAVKDRLTLGAAYFVADRTNLRQVVDPITGNQDITGRAVSQGVEFSATGSITERWSVLGGFAFIDSETKKSSTANTVGKELINTPDWSASIWTTYDLGSGWSVGAGSRYLGDRWANPANTAKLDDFLATDLMLAKQLNYWCRLQVNVDNVTDEKFIESARFDGAATGGSWAMPGAGRVITVSARMKF